VRGRRLLALGFAFALAACDAALPEPDSTGATLYATRCAGCHRLYAPGSLTAAMWEVTVTRMQGELARRGLPPLTADEQAALLDYLERHSTGRSDS
jgi:mono/diheme cytochrome c family protein